jgi:hypothetical protein
MASQPITPYQAPLLVTNNNNEEDNNEQQQQPLLSSIRHVAIASKSYRVFGLNDAAWSTARDDLRRYSASIAAADEGNESKNRSSSDHEEQAELLEICDAIYTALQIDAGGYGTAGFHLVSLISFFGMHI